MEHPRMATPDITDGNIDKIGALFPNCITETKDEKGTLRRMIDFDLLRQELSKDIVEGPQERYQFTWPDKRRAIRTANTPIDKTLRPCREESVDFDTTKNLYIEGDNLEALKLLRENYLGRVKMIYIDPPYNTGNDFVYRDDFSQSSSEYAASSGQQDESGNRLVANPETNGRFHTDWLNMIYPRLKVARDLLTEDGVIFISIDDNEVGNLKKVCDDVFGEHNFIDIFNWAKTETPENLSIKCRQIIEYVLCYQKQKNNVKFRGIRKYSSSSNGLLNQPNAIGVLKFPANIVKTNMSDRLLSAGMYGTDKYDVELLNDVKIEKGLFAGEFRLRARFKWQQSYLDNEIANGTEICIPTERLSPSYEKREYAPEVPTNLINSKVGVGTNENAGEYQLSLFSKKVFNFPKPTSLMEYLFGFLENKSEPFIILDFFSGSGSTADAVMRLNSEDNYVNQYIMVQLPEDLLAAKQQATSSNQKEIIENAIELCDSLQVPCVLSEVAKERIRRAGRKIREEKQGEIDRLRREVEALDRQIKASGEGSLFGTEDVVKARDEKRAEVEQMEKRLASLDTGFRVLKLDESNMLDVYYTPEKFDGELFEDNIKPGRSDEDLLFQVMLESNMELSCSIEKKTIQGKTVWFAGGNYLVACFEKNLDENVITEIARMKPYYFYMRDWSLGKDSLADNFDQLFEYYSPDTVRKIL